MIHSVTEAAPEGLTVARDLSLGGTRAADTRAAIVESNDVYRRALVLTLDEAIGIAVVADTAEMSGLHGSQPDLMVIGLESDVLCTAISSARDSFPGVAIVALVSESDPKWAYEAMRCGASGFVPKSAELKEIVECVEAVARGDLFIHPEVAGEALRWATSREEADATTNRLASLTRRECEVLDLLSEGLSTRTIAERLYLSRRTVEYHLGRIYRKLDVHRGIEAVIALKRLEDAG